MFLWQKYKKSVFFIQNDEQLHAIRKKFFSQRPEVIAWDTETTGLDQIRDKPFLCGFMFDDVIYVYEPTRHRNQFLLELASQPFVNYFIAHNAKFDYHMFRNFGTPIPQSVKIADSLSLARLTDYADTSPSISLESLGINLVDEESKFAAKVIKEHLKQINAERSKVIKEYVNKNLKISYTNFKDLYKKRVNFVDDPLNEHFDEIDKIAPPANYYDSYLAKPNLMINYLADDVFLVMEVYNKLITILEVVDKDFTTWKRENELISVVGDFERTGLKADINYLLKSRKLVMDYIKIKYNLLHELTGMKITSGQHKVIMKLFREKYKIGMINCDEDALEEIVKYYDGDAVKVAETILSLRSLDKWLSTYIEGMLNRIVEGKIYTIINNSGTVTGRVSSDMQQQPKKSLKDDEGNELFHPRKVFINDEDSTNYYIDFSNMELRVQAYYTLLTSDGDLDMCRAFIPFKCFNAVTGDIYDLEKDFDDWDSGNWVYEDGTPWKATDLHSLTTEKAFPEIDPLSDEFKLEYRELGKRANFLKNYGGGKKALIEQLKITDEVADALNAGYYKAFPKVLEYQKWVDSQIRQYGFVENLFGRRYYFSNSKESYKGYNYLIQGSCADYVKIKQIEIDDFLTKRGLESKMVLPIHDEIVFSIKKGEEYIMEDIRRIMENARFVLKTIPMVAEVSTTDTNWAEKRKC